MAYARIVQKWTDGTMMEWQVGVEGSYPDAVDEAVACVLRLYLEAEGEEVSVDDVETSGD